MADISTDSILLTIRKMIGPYMEYDAFDIDLIININSALMDLNQLGVGPEEGFLVTGEDETWTNFIGDFKDLESVKMYVYLVVKNLFDPPTNSFVLDAANKRKEELAWRINVQVESGVHNG